MFHVPEDSIRKGRENYGLRQKGKVATLALGYQGGPAALKNMREAYAIPEEELPDQELPDIVSRWRNANPNIAQFWYNVEEAALQAVTKGRKSIVGNLVYWMSLRTAFSTLSASSANRLCKLPSVCSMCS